VTWGLVVAGGSGERMRRSGSDVAKPLVRVDGITLLERNVLALLRHGVVDVAIAVAAAHDDVRAFAAGPCAERITGSGGRFQLIVEQRPLGSVGSARLVAPGEDTDVLVVNADNLTALDLGALLDDHRRSNATATLAVHTERFHMPFGEVTLAGDNVTAYTEKPTYDISIASAVTVLGRRAVDQIQDDEFLNLPHLAQRLLERGESIHAHRHDAPWVDVNDVPAAMRARESIAALSGLEAS
jgi:NDP-sugar pyrophosphorylase family protein